MLRSVAFVKKTTFLFVYQLSLPQRTLRGNPRNVVSPAVVVVSATVVVVSAVEVVVSTAVVVVSATILVVTAIVNF